MDQEVRKTVFCNLIVWFLVYLSTPSIKSMGLSGNLDALCAGLLVVAVCQLLFMAGRNAGAVLLAATVCLVLVFNIGSRFYLDQQQYYLSVQTFYLATEVLSLLESLAVWKLALGGACLALVLYLLLNLAHYVRLESRVGAVGSSFAMIVAVLGLQVVYADITREEIFDSSEATPIGYFIRSSGVLPFVRLDRERVVGQERKTILKKMLEDPSIPFPDKYSVDAIYSSLGRDPGFPIAAVNPKFPIYSRSDDLENYNDDDANKKYNVIVLVLESVRASEMGLYGAKNSATPFLDSLARDHVYSSKFYATSNFTVKSEHAINCSTYDFMIGAPVSKRGMPVRTQCLPDLLREAHNYQTLWFHGNDKDFYNRGQYLPKIGFQQIYSEDELNRDSQLPTLGWGISDPVLFELALEKLESIDGPFYSEILSVSNHMPFDFEWGIEFPDSLSAQSTMFDRYRRGIYYTDQAVKSLYEKFEKSSLAENTIFVITGDHGIWTFSDETKNSLKRNEEFFRVPLIMTIPGRDKIKIDGAHSHLDIAPTLLDVLQIEADNAFVGESIFSSNSNKMERTLYLMTEQSLSYRFKNKVCIPSIQCQNNINCYRSYELEPASTQCYAVDDNEDLLLSSDELVSDGSKVSARERALFDYTQMALELGTAPQFSPAVQMSASLEE